MSNGTFSFKLGDIVSCAYGIGSVSLVKTDPGALSLNLYHVDVQGLTYQIFEDEMDAVDPLLLAIIMAAASTNPQT